MGQYGQEFAAFLQAERTYNLLGRLGEAVTYLLVEDSYFWINALEGVKCLDNIKREGEGTLSLLTTYNMYRYAEMRGKLVSALEEGRQEHIDILLMRYRGAPYDR